MVEKLLLKIKRGESAPFRLIRGAARTLLYSNLPVPKFLYPALRGLYHLHYGILFGTRWALNYFYREPLFRARCTSVGKRLHLWLMPDIGGHAEIHIGDDVSIFGHFGVMTGRVFDKPRLIIGNGVHIGHNVSITVNREVVLEDRSRLASNIRIQDSDGHPRDAELRFQGAPPPPEEIKPVRICSDAWVGQGCYIMKGVTIGQGAIIGANSVVVTDIPPFSVAMGNPARVVVKDIRVAAAQASTSAPSSQAI